ncbi:MAG: GBS Bsp-like repeat-containing protein, partial [Streptococcus orisratti]|uniref:GBS Bsp-like repeat-containing protein n=1 Tax=Streptococcus orisratti TaxID=114652 RepID=UPI002352C4B9
MNSGTTKSVASKEETVEKTKVAVENYDSEDGYVDIVITQGTKTPEIRSIRVAAWSEDNQANLYWYVRDNVV